MQNQSNLSYRIVAHPYQLPEHFPVEWLGNYVQGDADITFLHYHNCIELGYCMEGSGLFYIDHQVFPFTQGDVCIIFRNQFHLAQSLKGHKSRWHFAFLHPEIWLSGIPDFDLSLTVVNSAGGGTHFPHILTPVEHPHFVGVVMEIMHELETKQPAYNSAVRGLIWNLMAQTGRILEQRAQSDLEPGRENGRANLTKIVPALDDITHHYMNAIHIGDLASLCNVSIPHFRRLFISCMGMAPLEYIVNVRIRMAADCLQNSEASVLDIAYRVGYSTLSSFNRHFKRLMGVSPSEWRRRQSN